MTILTRRLTLVPEDPSHERAGSRSPSFLSRLLGAHVPPDWPPDLYGEKGAAGLRHPAREPESREPGWSRYYFILHGQDEDKPVAVGIGGFNTKPSPDGSVEIEYAILPRYRRLGLASEAVSGLLWFAFRDRRVHRVVGLATAGHKPSIGVLRKNGFRLLGEAGRPEILRFEIDRVSYESGPY